MDNNKETQTVELEKVEEQNNVEQTQESWYMKLLKLIAVAIGATVGYSAVKFILAALALL